MQTHDDRDSAFPPKQGTIADRFLKELTGRAELVKAAERSRITGGFDGEEVLDKWESNGIQVVQRPPDTQDILRISVGGGDHLPVSLNYCVFRGDRGKCIDLLRRALKAMETDPVEPSQ